MQSKLLRRKRGCSSATCGAPRWPGASAGIPSPAAACEGRSWRARLTGREGPSGGARPATVRPGRLLRGTPGGSATQLRVEPSTISSRGDRRPAVPGGPGSPDSCLRLLKGPCSGRHAVRAAPGPRNVRLASRTSSEAAMGTIARAQESSLPIPAPGERANWLCVCCHSICRAIEANCVPPEQSEHYPRPFARCPADPDASS